MCGRGVRRGSKASSPLPLPAALPPLHSERERTLAATSWLSRLPGSRLSPTTALTLLLKTLLVLAQPKTRGVLGATAATPAAPVAKKVNLNTADAKELDTLPQIGEARAKSIIEARAKAKFKDWADFEARKVVPKNAEEAIKDKVSF